MPVRTIPDIIKREILFSGGVDEASAANKIDNEDCLEMENFRLSRDGKRTVKRLGLVQSANPEAADVFGHTTYYDENNDFCQIGLTSNAIWRKIADGDWSNIHTLAATLTHPVRILDIHDKQVIITEGDNRFVNAAGNDYQIGIDAPITIPSIATSFANTPPLDDDMGYANTTAMNVVWTQDDSGAVSALSETDPNSTEGPDGDSKYMYFSNASPSAGEYARRHQTLDSIGKEFNVEFDIYIDDLGFIEHDHYIEINIYNGVKRLRIEYDIEDFNIYDGSSWHTFKNWEATGGSTLDKWMNWKIVVESSYVHVYLDNVSLGRIAIHDPSTSTPGLVDIKVHSESTTGTHNTHVYFDNFKIGGTEGGNLRGKYKYAVTFARSGNYGAESNPIKSLITSSTHVGSGTEEAASLTTGGTYTGAESKTFRIRIDGTDADTYEWSENNGETWNSTDIPIVDGEDMYLSYGVTIKLLGTTNHTLGDYWYFNCNVCSITAPSRQVALSTIPVDSNSSNTGTDIRKLYRTVAGGTRYYWLAKIHDNETTTFVDNIPDSMLGSELQEDHDVLPNGRLSCWWDNKLWVSGKRLDEDGVAMDAEENLVYYSRTDEPEHFDIANRCVIIRKGDTGDEISGMIPYKDNLYVFKRNSIYIIQKKSYGLYGRYLIDTDIGCVAPWSLIEVNNLLMFLSYRGWELYNGFEPYSMVFSVPLIRTLDTIDTSEKDNFSEPTLSQASDHFYIADEDNQRVKKHLCSDLSYVSKFGTSGSGNYNFNLPQDVCEDELYLYITDYTNNRIIKRKKSDFSYVAQIGSEGSGNDQFDGPIGICTDETYLYVCDNQNHRIKKHLCSDLSYVAKIGSEGSGNDQFDVPFGICTDGTHVYITDERNYRIKKHLCADLSYVAKMGSQGSGDDQFHDCKGICTDNTHLYISDFTNERVKKHLCSDLSYVAKEHGSGDDELHSPAGITTDNTYIYIAELTLAEIQKRLCADLSFDSKAGSYGTGNDQMKDVWGMGMRATQDFPTISGYLKIVSTHLRKRNEVWMSIPYRTGSLDPCTCVYNYARNKFYIFTFHKTPTYLGDARDSNKAMQNYMGTGDGYLFLCDSTYRDDTTNITAKIRKGWIEPTMYADWRRVEVEFEIPNGKILTMNCFVNFDKDVARTDTMTGVSLNATDIELRRVIRDFSELGLRGKYFAIQFTNAENLGGDLKLNRAYIYYHPRAIKGTITGV